MRAHPRIHTDNGETCRAAALDHEGIILQPDSLVGDDPRRGTLAEPLPGFASLTIGIHAVYPSRKLLPFRSRRMVDCLAGAFAEPTWWVDGKPGHARP